MPPFNIAGAALISAIYLCLVIGAEATPYYTELETLSLSQRATLQKLKSSVKSILPHDYMREDIWLVKFLQVNNWSLKKAEQMVKESVKWRKENQVDQWKDPSYFAEFEKDFPIYVDGYDKEGRPLFETFFGDWNVRSVALQGKIKKLSLYALSKIELANEKIREQQAKGLNVTELLLIANMEGFTIINQACPACLPYFLGYMTGLEKNWPHSVAGTVLINTPDTFETILNLMRPTMSPQSRRGFKVFGANKAEWKPYVDSLADNDQLSDWFGGDNVFSLNKK